MACTCGHITLGLGTKPVALSWTPDCPEHGTQSEWYRSPEQVAKRERNRERTRELQRQAAEARRRTREARFLARDPREPYTGADE